MDANLIALAFRVTGAVVIVAVSRLGRGRLVDLGTVSHQWMAEHRLGREYDRQR